MSDIKSEAIALAALFQCSLQIDRLSQTGYYDEKAVATVIRALLVTKPKTIEDIYNPSDLTVGFRQLINSTDKSDTQKVLMSRDITSLAFKIIELAVRVEKNSRVFAKLSDEIDSLENAVLTEHENFLEGDAAVVNLQSNFHLFGSLYQSIISPNFPPLIIYGQENILKDTDNQEKIRSLLLAGIRAVLLWRQVGGRRRYFIFRRNKILETAKKFA